MLNGGSDGKKVVATYDYTDADGKLLNQKLRYVPKGFAQRRPDGNGGWVYDMKGVEPVLYNLAEIVNAKSIVFVEGEKDVETARKIGLVATTSGGVNSWRGEFAELLREKRVAIIAAADDPGRKHARRVAADLAGVAESAWLLEMPGEKDLTGWVENGGTKEEGAVLAKGDSVSI